MYFTSFRIHNYKSYRDSTRFDLEPGINVVVGKNNAGKTALLEALSLRFTADPHRSALTVPTESDDLKQISGAECTFNLAKQELISLLVKAQSGESNLLCIPLPALADPIWTNVEQAPDSFDSDAANHFIEWFLSQDAYTFRMRPEAIYDKVYWREGDPLYVSPRLERSLERSKGVVEHYGEFRVEPYEKTISYYGCRQVSGGDRPHFNDFIFRLGRYLHEYVYLFRAERIPFEPCQLGVNRRLDPDARNLAEVIHLLQQNLNLSAKFNGLVREVLPEVRQVGTRRLDENKGEVIVWTDEDAVSREDLAFSLKECGAGVGQVLSILYVLLTATNPQTILLDEPQSFLHPGAARKLVEIIRSYSESKHQIIIATHSPTVITSADPAVILLVEQKGPESVIERVDIKQAKQQRNYLRAIGARLSDVFGYDRVLWVEGETEELCFPMILRGLARRPLLGTAILSVQNPGDFNRKDRRNVVRIYERLSQLDRGLVPPVVGFIFDREIRDDREVEDLKRLSRDTAGRSRVHFISKRLYENFLLNPAGIAAVANGIRGFSDREVTEEQVQEWITEKRRDRKYFAPLKVAPRNGGAWTDTVNGALLLTDLFADLSGGLVPYEKTEHSPALTAWLIENAREDLRALSDLLLEVLDM